MKYACLVLSGGSTMFKDFGRRLQRDVNKLINNRIKESQFYAGNNTKSQAMEVQVHHRIWLTYRT